MEYNVGDLVKLDKKHPCGCDIWEIIRIGMDIKLRCNKCHRIIILGRAQFVDLLVSVEVKEQVEFKTSNLHNTLSDGKNWIRNIENPTMDDMKQSVKENAMTIRFIINPPDEIIKMAIKQNPMCIQYLNNLSQENMKYALEQNVAAIRWILNPSNEIVNYAKQIDSEKMKRYILNESGRYVKCGIFYNEIEHINEFDDKKILQMIKQDPSIIQYLDNPTQEMIIAAIEKQVNVIRFVKNPTMAVLEKAVEKDAIAMQKYEIDSSGNVVIKKSNDKNDILQIVIGKLSEEEQILIRNPKIIQTMDVVPYELQLAAVKRDYLNLRYIKKIDSKIYEYLYDDTNFDVYSLTDDFGLQLKIVSRFEKIKKDREVISEKKTTEESVEVEEIQIDFDSKLFDIWGPMNQQKETAGSSIRLISNEIPISAYINYFGEKIGCNSAKIASGFLYKSGLKMIEPIIQRITESNEGIMELIVGSLKDYFHSSTDNKLVNIDLETAKMLNELLTKKMCNVYTLENQFYHGKYFFFEGEKESFCIVGSSNLTYSGFAGNYEINTLYYFKNGTEQYISLKEWFDGFIYKCTKIDNLSECNFADTNMKFDTINAGTSIESVDINSIENEIQSLTDEELKFRLNLWLDKKPTNIYRKLDIENLKDYVAFEFKEHKLVVFESFEAGNGYYYFHGNNIFELVQKVKDMSKTQIFELAGMEKRGYHIRDRKVLKRKIYGLFVDLR